MNKNEYEFQYPEFQEEEESPSYMEEPRLTFGESLHYMLGAVSAGLVIAGVFLLAAFIFILFCIKVWL